MDLLSHSETFTLELQPVPASLFPSPISDRSFSLLGDTIALARQVAEALDEVPYVKAVTGTVLQIIRFREELIANKERCEEIIETVCQHSYKLLRSLDVVSKSSESGGLASLKGDLEEYRQLLNAISQGLAPFANSNFTAKWNRLISRAKHASDLTKLERRLSSFDQAFSFSRLTEIEVKITEFASTLRGPQLQDTFVPQALPPPPPLVVGREVIVDSIVNSVIHAEERRIAILGPGGIGKTTVASQILHHFAIRDRHPTRLFVSCEASTTAEHLLTSLADALAIPEDLRRMNLESLVIHRLASFPAHTLLCLDNLETTWDDPVHRPSVDVLLGKLSSLGSSLTLLITMRGTQTPAPSTVRWKEFILEGLDLAWSVKVYEFMAGIPVDQDAMALLAILDGLPLAISLFARLVYEGDTPADLLYQWQDRGTTILENGGLDRLSTLNFSIQLSISSPRMDDSSRRVLTLLACLPVGLKDTPESLDWFQGCFPGSVLHIALRSLRRMGLVYKQDDVRFGHRRWQLLCPVREYCRRFHCPSEDDYFKLITLWSSFLLSHERFSNHPPRAIIEPELPNFRALLLRACSLPLRPENLSTAIIAYTDWAGWVGLYDIELGLKAVETTQEFGEAAKLHHTIGVQALTFRHLNDAEDYLQKALNLHVGIGDLLGEANTLKRIGDLHMFRNQLGDAEEPLRRALDRYVVMGDQLGHANALGSLGDLQMRLDELDDAEETLRSALELYVKIDNRRGEANSLKRIGDLQIRQDQLHDAEESFQRALGLYFDIDSLLGQANCFDYIGRLQLRQHQFTDAERSLRKAFDLYFEIDNKRGQAGSLKRLGDLQLYWDKLHDAEKSWHRALDLYVAIDDQCGQADTLKRIGDLQSRRGQLHNAEKSLYKALDIYMEIGSQRGQANSFKSLGDLQLHRSQFADANELLTRALDLFVETGDCRGQADSLKRIGDLQSCWDKLDDAEKTWHRALDLYVKLDSQSGQVNCLKHIADLQMHWEQLDDAEESLRKAFDLYVDIGNKRGQANSLKDIGDLHLRRNLLKDAEDSFRGAFELYVETDDQHGQADALRFIAGVQMRRDQFGDAEKSLRKAFNLYVEVNDLLGQGNSLLSFGDLHMCQYQLDDAEKCLRMAQAAYVAINTRPGQANCHWCIADIFMQRGKLRKAEEEVTIALEQHHAILNQWGQAAYLILGGRIQIKLGKLGQGEESIILGLAIARENEVKIIEGQAHRGLGELALAREEHDQAIKEFETAVEIHRASQHPYEMRLDIRGLIHALIVNGKSDEAIQWEKELTTQHMRSSAWF